MELKNIVKNNGVLNIQQNIFRRQSISIISVVIGFISTTLDNTTFHTDRTQSGNDTENYCFLLLLKVGLGSSQFDGNKIRFYFNSVFF